LGWSEREDKTRQDKKKKKIIRKEGGREGGTIFCFF